MLTEAVRIYVRALQVDSLYSRKRRTPKMFESAISNEVEKFTEKSCSKEQELTPTIENKDASASGDGKSLKYDKHSDDEKMQHGEEKGKPHMYKMGVLENALTGELQKDKSIKMFFEAFKANIENCDDALAALLSKEITDEIFKKESSGVAKLLRSKCLNLKDVNNPNLCMKVYNGKISPSEYVGMTPEEMKSESLRNEEMKIIKNSIYKSQMPVHEAETDIFVCSNCGKRQCSYRQLQTGSGDEPMTTFVLCVCGHRWRFR